MAQTELLCPLTGISGRGHFAFPGVLVRVEAHLGPDGERYVTRAHAAELKGVSTDTLDGWVRKGYLSPVPGCPPRRRLFRLADVDEAELKAYQAAVRTSGSDKRVTRAFSDAA